MGFDHDAGTECLLLGSSSSRQSRECEKASHSLSSSFRDCWSDGSCVQCDTIWPAVHETPAVVAQDQGIFPEGKSTSHDQGLSTVCASPRHVEETLFLNLGPVLGAPCRQLSLATDASLTGWGAVMSGRSARGL